MKQEAKLQWGSECVSVKYDTLSYVLYDENGKQISAAEGINAFQILIHRHPEVAASLMQLLVAKTIEVAA